MWGRDREQKEKIPLEKHKWFSDAGKLLPFPFFTKAKGEPENAKPVHQMVRNTGPRWPRRSLQVQGMVLERKER